MQKEEHRASLRALVDLVGLGEDDANGLTEAIFAAAHEAPGDRVPWPLWKEFLVLQAGALEIATHVVDTQFDRSESSKEKVNGLVDEWGREQPDTADESVSVSVKSRHLRMMRLAVWTHMH